MSTSSSSGHPKECQWCECPLPVGRRHGSERKFCSDAHRHAHDRSLRQHALGRLARGEITVADLRAEAESVGALAGPNARKEAA